MANGFIVTAAKLRSMADELRQLLAQYKSKVDSLSQSEMALRSMWEGEANNAFQRAFANDKVNLERFYQVIEKYIQALITAAEQYEKAEQQAVQIATERKY